MGGLAWVGAVAGRVVRRAVVTVGGEGWGVRLARGGVRRRRPACGVRCGVSGVRGEGARQTSVQSWAPGEWWCVAVVGESCYRRPTPRK